MEAGEAGFEGLDDLFDEIIGFGQVIQICQALVFEPSDVETGLVARADFLIAVAAPAAFQSYMWEV